ncbi:hypothetical protein H8S95_02545 [Pontibacter sp. KCTC 32443]|uniref:hypothetical protein n=1 Tax=Pontibacter TaxID=323449 RepID=UPI00164EA337|nr:MULTISPECIES: hypothetical protein [Pontibacter]MBC5772928.1 hypothetical protein [Pontibacter sp. KCTC 32443]
MNTNVNVIREEQTAIGTVKNTMFNGWVKMGNILAQTDYVVTQISSDPFKNYNKQQAIRDQKSWVRW